MVLSDVHLYAAFGRPASRLWRGKSVAGYTGLMLAQTVAHTDGQTRRILKYRWFIFLLTTGRRHGDW